MTIPHRTLDQRAGIIDGIVPKAHRHEFTIEMVSPNGASATSTLTNS